MIKPYETQEYRTAAGLIQLWPEDKTVPMQLADLYNQSEGNPAVGMFFEALVAAAEGDDLELVWAAREALIETDDED